MDRRLTKLQIDARMARRFKTHRRCRTAIKTFVATAVLIAFALLFVMPIVLTITNSFMTKSEIAANYGSVFSNSIDKRKSFVSKEVNLKFIPDEFSFSQYNTVLFKSPDYLFKFWNSVKLTVPIMIFQVLVSIWAAYGLSRYRRRWKEVVFFIYIILMLMPYQVTLVPNYLVADRIGLIDTYWSIWLPGIFSPFAVYMLTKYMRRIPSGIIEAAQIDGCSEWRIFWLVAFPLCKGAMASVAILIFIDYWNMVEQPIILLPTQDLHPLSVFLSKINTGEIGLAFAIASIYLFLPLFVFLYGEEYLIDGISFQGGVKG